MHPKSLGKRWSLALVFLFFSLVSANAELLATATLEGTYLQMVEGYDWRQIVLSPGPAYSLPFVTDTDNQTVAITYSGSCMAFGFTISIRANIDGVIADPGSTKGGEFCNVPLTGSIFPATRVFFARIAKKGQHRLSIEVKGSTNAGFIVGDSALMVAK